jgi:hypothetical protein
LVHAHEHLVSHATECQIRTWAHAPLAAGSRWQGKPSRASSGHAYIRDLSIPYRMSTQHTHVGHFSSRGQSGAARSRQQHAMGMATSAPLTRHMHDLGCIPGMASKADAALHLTAVFHSPHDRRPNSSTTPLQIGELPLPPCTHLCCLRRQLRTHATPRAVEANLCCRCISRVRQVRRAYADRLP